MERREGSILIAIIIVARSTADAAASVARRALAADNLTLREWRIMMVVFLFGPSMAREISEKALLDPAMNVDAEPEAPRRTVTRRGLLRGQRGVHVLSEQHLIITFRARNPVDNNIS